MSRHKRGGKETAVPTRGELEKYFVCLALDMNLRLVCERERDGLHPPERLLWVDGIVILSYEPGICYRDGSRGPVCLRRIREAAGRLAKRLMERWERRTPLALKKINI